MGSLRPYVPKADTQVALAAVDASTLSARLSMADFNSVLMHCDVTGTGDWTISIQGAMTVDGTLINMGKVDGDGSAYSIQFTVDAYTTFRGVPDWIAINAIENSGTSTLTVTVQGVNL